MPEDDHRFKKKFIEVDSEEFKAKKAVEFEEKLANFEWEDSEEENEEALPFIPPIDDLDSCVSVLSSYLLEQIDSTRFEGMDTDGMRFIIPIDLDLHPLLHERFVEDWTLESRITMFNCIRDQLIAEFTDADRSSILDTKITDALPASHRKRFKSATVQIHDDALAVGDDSNTIAIEIPVHFVAN